MPTRKQRKRALKERRHEYETVWVDAEGNELDDAPDDYDEPAPREKRTDGKKPQAKRPAQRTNRATRTPDPPSWRRAIRRGAILGTLLMVFLYISDAKASPATRVVVALVYGVPYTGMFIAFTYYFDRFMYRRWLRKSAEHAKKR